MNVMTDTGTRAVTVCRGTRRVDVRLPAAVPVAELMPGLLDLVDGDVPSRSPSVGGTPRTWELVPVGRPPLDWGRTLTDAGVADGDVLYLAEEKTAATGAAIYDVADLAAARIELAGPSFGREHAAVAWPAAAALAGVVASVLPPLGLDIHPWALTAAAVVLLVVTALRPRQPLPDTLAGQLVGAAVPAAAICCAVSAAIGWLDGQPASIEAGVAGGVAAALGVALWVATEERLVGAFAAVAGAAVGLAAGLDAATLSTTQVALAVGGLAFVSIGVTPRIAVVTGGMGGLDLLVRTGGSPDEAAVGSTVGRAHLILIGLLAGCATTVGAGAVVLAAGTPSAIVTAALLAAGLLVRAQAFTRPAHRLVVRYPALVAAASIPVVAGAPLELVAVAAVVLPLAVATGLTIRWPHDVLPRLRLAVGWLEVAIVVGLVPAIATAAGLFALLTEGTS
jgi:type VII secretion integral membrane protein EccD